MNNTITRRRRVRAALSAFAVAIPLAVGSPAASAAACLDVDTTAHRGAAGVTPENTEAGFDFARHTRSEYIELDVQLSEDGVPVLIHDAGLTRTTDVEQVFPDADSYAVGDFTWAELQQLDAGSWYHEDFAGERIPRLEDAIEYARSGAGINIELKDPDSSPGVEQVVADVLAADPRWHALEQRDGLIVSSFDIDSLETFHEIDASVPLSGIGLVPADDASLDSYAEWLEGWTANYRTLAPEDVERVQDAGLELTVYTVNSVEHMTNVIDLGVDGIVTDYPESLQNLKCDRDPLPDANGVVVSDVLGDAPGNDLTYNNGEYVELTNTTAEPVDVTGWYLLDAVANKLVVGPGYVIEPGETLRVYTGPGDNTENRYYNDRGSNVLNNNGDSVALFTTERDLLSLYAYY